MGLGLCCEADPVDSWVRKAEPRDGGREKEEEFQAGGKELKETRLGARALARGKNTGQGARTPSSAADLLGKWGPL